MYNTSNWTGRTPRSTSEAFGPYERFTVEAPPAKKTSRWFPVYCVILVAVVTLLTLKGIA